MLKDLLERGKCLMGVHQGAWTFDGPDRCTQTRVCSVCGVASTQVEHRWTDWTLVAGTCGQTRRCERCREEEAQAAHDWSPWEYSEAHHAPLRVCLRCGEQASRFARQTIGERAVPVHGHAAEGAAPVGSVQPSERATAGERQQAAGIVRLFTSGDTAARLAFVEQCPDSPLKPTVLEAVGSGHPEVQFLALCMLADPCCRGIDPPLGIAIVQAVYSLSQRAYTATRSASYLDTGAQAAVTCLLGYASVGRHSDAAEFGAAASDWLDGEGHTDKKAVLLMSRIDAHLSLQQFDEAGALLQAAEAIAIPPDQPADRRRLQDLRRTFDALARQRATELPPPAPVEADAIGAARSDLAGQIQQLQALVSGQESASIRNVVGALAAEAEKGAPTSQAAWAVESQPLADQLTEVLSGGAGGMTQLRNRNRTIKASLIFADPLKARDPAAIEESLAILLEARGWAASHDCANDEGTALWGLYLCYSRTGRPEHAIDALQALRANLEARRRRIADPLERAGAMREYPHLFPALCQLLCRAGRAADLVAAMEGAKGRVLSDVLTAARSEVVPDASFVAGLDALVRTLRIGNAHYLSFFVDDDETYAALVTREGATHCRAIPIGRDRLRSLAETTDPRSWSRARGGLFAAKPTAPLPAQLSGLVDWLEPFVEAGTIQRGDHLCYCPDDELHLVPVHYLPFRGEPLVRHFSISRIHSAAALTALLGRPAERPAQFVAAQVPAQQDRGDPEKLSTLARASAWLAEHLSGTTLVRERATLEALATLDLTDRVVHFATHGTFPLKDQPDRNPNPFHASGLAFAKDGALPSLALVAAGTADDTLLTPERVLKLDFSRSHVTLQACVSGLAKEGIGGDALGLELALLLAGAQSLLTTHWNIPAGASADFAIRFYRRWLLDNTSRGQAWQGAILDLMAEERPPGVPGEYYWAGFSLSGDWR